jgi:POT family proton-dependent oligopeptide transporter
MSSNTTPGSMADSLETGKAEGDDNRRGRATPPPGSPDPNRRRTLGFSCLFLIEMWERFGFYGMQILIVVFLTEYLGFGDSKAFITWGAFALMIYTTPIVGGWLGDRVLGTRRITLLGGIVLGIGYLLLALPLASKETSWFIFFAFGVIAVGNGLFKANPNNLLSQLYENDRSKLDSAFTIYYMSINMGALASQFLTPFVRLRYGWHLAFGISFIGLALGVINFLFMKRYLSHVGSKPDFEPFPTMRLLAVLAGSLVIAIIIALIVHNPQVAKGITWAAVAVLIAVFGYLMIVRHPSERKGLIATMILTLQGLVFFIFYQQMSTSLTLFALRNINLDAFGFHLAPEQFQLLNPFWIFLLSPILAWLYNSLGRRDKDFNIATKFAFGFVLVAFGFAIYGFSGHIGENIVSPWWLVAGYFCQSFGELLISGLGLAMVARFVAHDLRGLIMGGWLLTTGISQMLGSMVAGFTSVPDKVGGVIKMLPTGEQHMLAQVPAQLAHTLHGLNLGALRYWLAGHPVTAAALKNTGSVVQQDFKNFSDATKHTLQQLPAFSGLPQNTQNILTRMNQDFYHTTLINYTNLFFILCFVAAGVAIISFALVPFLKRLAAAHASGTSPESAVLGEHERASQPGGR